MPLLDKNTSPLETAEVEAFFVPFFKNPAYPTSLPIYICNPQPVEPPTLQQWGGWAWLSASIGLKEVGCLFHSILRYDQLKSNEQTYVQIVIAVSGYTGIALKCLKSLE